jgi:hypothetical protein
MPEHETFDLDAAFARLEQDVAGSSAPRGAAAAITTARRRRRTTIGGVAAAVLLVAGVAAAGAGIGHHDGSPEPAGRPLPAPAPLSVQGLDDATRGWTGSWQDYTAANRKDFRNQVNVGCSFLVNDQTVAQPTRNGSGIFLTTDGSQAVQWRIGIRGTRAATQEYDATVAAFDACPSHDDRTFTYPGGGEATVAALPAAGQTGGDVVVVATRYHDRAGVLLLGRVPLPTPAQAAGLADAVLAATVDDATYGEAGPAALRLGASGMRPQPAPLAGTVSTQALEPALTGWSTPWDPRFPKAVPVGSLAACLGNPEGNDPGEGLILNVGRNGVEWVHGFVSEAAATGAAAGIRVGLETCSTPYDVHSVTLPSGRSVVVAEGPRMVLWSTRVGSRVLVLQLPTGSSRPPRAVSVRVGQVLEQVLETLPNVAPRAEASR